MSQPDDKMVSGPAPSSGQFVLWFLLLAAMIVATWYNYTLIVTPMSEMVGGKAVIGGANAAEVAAGLIVILEIFQGIFLLEAIGVTTFFPVIHELNDLARKGLKALTLFLLSMFALIESGLVWMHDVLVVQEGIAVRQDAFAQLPLVAQMAIVFIMPFVLMLGPLSADRVVRMLRGQPV